MTYYDPLRGRPRLPFLQTTVPSMAGTGSPYMRIPESPVVMTGHLLGAQPVPGFGSPRAMSFSSNMAPANQQFAQQPFANQVPTQPTSTYGTSPAAQYIAATQAASAQANMPGGQPITGIAGGIPTAATHYSQPPTSPYNSQGVPSISIGGGVPIPGTGNQTTPTAGPHSYPGASAQYGYSNQPGMGDYLSPRRSKKKKKSKVRRILEELLAGTATTVAAENILNKKNQKRKNDPVATTSQRPPKGSALGFLHPKGHFVPSALDYMIEHFIHGKKERNLAPEGARTGYLHPGGHFVPMSMEELIEEFKYTLLGHHKRRHSPHGRSTARSRDGHVSSSSESEYSDSDDSDTSSEHSAHRVGSSEGTY